MYDEKTHTEREGEFWKEEGKPPIVLNYLHVWHLRFQAALRYLRFYVLHFTHLTLTSLTFTELAWCSKYTYRKPPFVFLGRSRAVFIAVDANSALWRGPPAALPCGLWGLCTHGRPGSAWGAQKPCEGMAPANASSQQVHGERTA